MNIKESRTACHWQVIDSIYTCYRWHRGTSDSLPFYLPLIPETAGYTDCC